MKKDIRTYSGNLEVRASDDGEMKIEGYASVFNSRSELLGWYYEYIEEGFFDDVLTDDVRALFNHDANYVLGRTVSNTLSLSVDNTGLRYIIDLRFDVAMWRSFLFSVSILLVYFISHVRMYVCTSMYVVS